MLGESVIATSPGKQALLASASFLAHQNAAERCWLACSVRLAGAGGLWQCASCDGWPVTTGMSPMRIRANSSTVGWKRSQPACCWSCLTRPRSLCCSWSGQTSWWCGAGIYTPVTMQLWSERLKRARLPAHEGAQPAPVPKQPQVLSLQYDFPHNRELHEKVRRPVCSHAWVGGWLLTRAGLHAARRSTGSDAAVAPEQYRNPWGSVRIGKLLEDLDSMAGNIACAAMPPSCAALPAGKSPAQMFGPNSAAAVLPGSAVPGLASARQLQLTAVCAQLPAL